MEWQHDGISITDDLAAVDLDVVHARVVTDRATFAYLCDVFVLDGWRGRGLGRRLAQLSIEHPDVASCRRLLLATRDAHAVYAPLGFAPVPDPENLLGISRDPAELYGT